MPNLAFPFKPTYAPDPQGSPLLIGVTDQDKAELFRRLRDELHNVADSLPFPEGDVRRGVVNRLIGNVATYISILNLATWGESNPQQYASILEASSPELVEFGRTDLFRAAKFYFNVDGQFQIENGLKQLLLALRPQFKPKGYYGIAEEVIKACGLPEPDKKHRYLYVSAQIRNSLHNNGVHLQETVPLQVLDGVTYRFEEGKKVNCAPVEYILHAMKCAIGVVRDLILSGPSKDICFIEDPFDKQRRDEGHR